MLGYSIGFNFLLDLRDVVIVDVVCLAYEAKKTQKANKQKIAPWPRGPATSTRR